MKFSKIIFSLLFLVLTTEANAQEESKLTLPTSPAFSILDFEPSAVMRPTNVKGLAADVLNSFDKEGKLMMNLGIEVAPYWLASHPNLEREEYLKPNVGQTFLQSLSLSAATVKDSVTGYHNLSGGFRFKLLNGKPKDNLYNESSFLQSKITVVGALAIVRAGITAADTKASVIAKINAVLGTPAIPVIILPLVNAEALAISGSYVNTVPSLTLFVEKLIESRVNDYANLAAKVSKLLYERKGLILEFAGAMGYSYLDDKSGTVNKTGIWANLSYGVSSDAYFTLTTRYMFKKGDSSINNFDVGLGFLKKANNYNVSLEAMLRHYNAEVKTVDINNLPILKTDKNFSYRLALQASYMINKDLSLNLSLGKTFDEPFVSYDGFFSIFGLNYSLFAKKPDPLSLK